MNKLNNWELSLGTYPGFLIGIRSYAESHKTNHVLYIQAAREELQDLSEEALIDRHRDDYETINEDMLQYGYGDEEED